MSSGNLTPLDPPRQTPTAREPIYTWQTAVRAWVYILGIAALFGLGYWFWWRQPPSTPLPTTAVNQSGQTAISQELKKLEELMGQLKVAREGAQVELETLRRQVWDKKTTAALGMAKTDDFLARAQEIKLTLAKLEKEAEGWGPRFKEIMTGDAGKKLAGNRAQVEQITMLAEKDRLSADLARSWMKQLKALVEPVEEAAKAEDKQFSPDEALTRALETLGNNARKRLQEFDNDRNLLDTLLSQAEKTPAESRTLQEAVQEQSADQERKRLAMIAAAKQAALDEVAKKIAEAEAKGAQEIGEIKLKQTLEQTSAEKQQLEAVVAKLKVERERKQLEARYEAALPEIKHHLAPFIAKGYRQPDGPGRLELTTKLEPMSLSRIVAAGCLREGKNGMQNLVDIGSNFHNDRYQKNFPIQGFLNVKDMPFLQRAQDLLKEFGPIMVEKGLLAP